MRFSIFTPPKSLRRRPGWKTALLAGTAALALAFGATSPAAADGQSTPQLAKAMQSAKINRVDVIAANDLVGRKVLASDMQPVGQLKFLMIRPDTGEIIYALVGDEADHDMAGQLVAVPWESVDTDRWLGEYMPGLTLKVSRATMEKAPRWSIDRLLRLTEPTVMTGTYSYFGIAAPEDTATRDRTSDLIVGRGIIADVGAPPLVAENQLRGTPVETEMGGDLGAIDELVVDIDRGRVAYALLARGGYLGSGGDWLAVPVQAFDWTGTEKITVDISADDFSRLKGLDKAAGIPTWVRKSDLEELYEGFDVDPYWVTS